MKYLNTLNEGERVNGIYFCRQKTSATTKNGKEYVNLTLQDKTGTIDSKVWNPSSPGVRDDFDSLDYVVVTGEVTVFNGGLQLNVSAVQKAEPGTYNEADYLPSSERDIDEMFAELMDIMSKVKNENFKKLINHFFVENTDFIEKFKKHSAAKRVHHGFIGGLLEHTLGVVKLCEYIANNYQAIDKDLLLTAAAFHDIGKVYELSDFPENDYTDEGQLLGHIVMGSELVATTAKKIDANFPAVPLRQLRHCILAHHGEFEYGSPKKPALIEAVALHYADDLDAKLETFKEAIATPAGQSGEWTGFNKMLDSNIRKTIN